MFRASCPLLFFCFIIYIYIYIFPPGADEGGGSSAKGAGGLLWSAGGGASGLAAVVRRCGFLSLSGLCFLGGSSPAVRFN